MYFTILLNQCDVMNKISKMLTSVIVELPCLLDMVVKIFAKFQVTCPLLLPNPPRSSVLPILLDLLAITIWLALAVNSDKPSYVGRRAAACVLGACMGNWKYQCSVSVLIDKSLWNAINHKECWIIPKKRGEGYDSSST